MSLSRDESSTGSIAELLAAVRKREVRFWSEDGQLRYKAPSGALSREDIERLRASKDEVLALLEGVESLEPRLTRRQRFDRAPMAFSQLAHWNVYHLSERRAIRQIVSATRLSGRLNISALQTSLAEIVRRHDALRTRIVILEGVPVQEIVVSDKCEIRTDDLRKTPEDRREAEVIRAIEEHELEPIDVAVGPLFGVRLLQLRDEEHVLILAMEHMISDARSMGILLRELFSAYAQALRGHPFSLPPVPIHFADYAVWQSNAHKSWVARHGTYWDEQLRGCGRVRFSDERSSPAETSAGWGIAPIQIGRNLKAELREWCRLRGTTLVMSVFTAYIALALRWCNVSESVVQYQSDGRFRPELENAIGYFSSVLYLRVHLRKDDTFVDLLRQVTDGYCEAYEHADSSYMASQVPRPEFTRNTIFNWVPHESGNPLSHLEGSKDEIRCSPVPFVHPMLKTLDVDNEPGMLLYDTDQEVVGYQFFPRNRFSTGVMDKFGRNFLMFVDALLRRPQGRVADISLL